MPAKQLLCRFYRLDTCVRILLRLDFLRERGRSRDDRPASVERGDVAPFSVCTAGVKSGRSQNRWGWWRRRASTDLGTPGPGGGACSRDGTSAGTWGGMCGRD